MWLYDGGWLMLNLGFTLVIAWLWSPSVNNPAYAYYDGAPPCAPPVPSPSPFCRLCGRTQQQCIPRAHYPHQPLSADCRSGAECQLGVRDAADDDDDPRLADDDADAADAASADAYKVP